MKSKIPAEEIENIEKLYAGKMSVKRISKITGYSRGTIFGLTKGKELYGSHKGYLEHLAKRNGYESLWDYRKKRYDMAKDKPENKALSALISTRLEELGRNNGWLAEQINVTCSAVDHYCKCRTFPKKNRLRKIFKALDVRYRNVKDLLKEKALLEEKV